MMVYITKKQHPCDEKYKMQEILLSECNKIPYNWIGKVTTSTHNNYNSILVLSHSGHIIVIACC